MPLVRLLVLLSLSAAAGAAAPARPYGLDWHARFLPGKGYVEARLEVTQSLHRLIEVDFNAPAPRYSHFEGDGSISREDERLIWQVPRKGGELRYRVQVDHERSGAHDALMTRDWAIARLDDLFPPAGVRSRVYAHSEARLYLEGPAGWSFESRYGPVDADGVAVETDSRRFERPLGWLAAGDLGIRRTRVSDRRIAIAGPKDQDFRRLDVLTFLRWTLPELTRIAPSLPERVVIVGGGREMWRGGLSGPGSLYVHPDRPLVSGNGTSTLLHELMHVATGEPPAKGADWIAEGIAEYYSLAILERTGGISRRRFRRTLERLEHWAREENGELTDPSTGADTARAVLLFHDLDRELRGAGASLDVVTAELLAGRISLKRLADLVCDVLGEPSTVLAPVLEDAGASPRG